MKNNLKQSVWQLLASVLFVLLIQAPTAHALRDVRVRIPHAVRRGEKAILRCLYDIEDDSLYSVKWYKGRREFYRYTPNETPPMKIFQFPGIKIKRLASNESQVMLDAVTMASAGKYSCEVSADAPSFHTLIGAAELEVIEPPHNLPVMTGIRQRYRIDDILRGNCTSRHSKPAANLTWTVNNEEVNAVFVRHYKISREPRHDLETATIGIHFVVNEQHFLNGKMKLRCTATIFDIYHKAVEKTIIETELYNRYANNINMIQPESEHADPHPLHDGEILQKKTSYLTQLQDFIFQFGQSHENNARKNYGDDDDDEDSDIEWATSSANIGKSWQLFVLMPCICSDMLFTLMSACWQLAKLLIIGMLTSCRTKLPLMLCQHKSASWRSSWGTNNNTSASYKRALGMPKMCVTFKLQRLRHLIQLLQQQCT